MTFYEALAPILVAAMWVALGILVGYAFGFFTAAAAAEQRRRDEAVAAKAREGEAWSRGFFTATAVAPTEILPDDEQARS